MKARKNSWLLFLIIPLFFTAGCVEGPLLRSEDGPTGPPHGVARENMSLRPKNSPLSVGDSSPDFILIDQMERDVSSGELRSGKGSVLIFLPGSTAPAARSAYDWGMRHQGFLAQQGIEVLYVAPESEEYNLRAAQDRGLRQAILSDPGSWVARAFGVVPRGRRTPSTATLFLLGNDGRIHYTSTSYPAPSEIVVAATTMPGRPRDPFFSF